MKVSALMTADPVTISLDAGLEDALTLMDSQDFRHLPVVGGKQLVGIISERDLLEALGRLPGELPRDEAETDVLASERPSTVREVVHKNVRIVNPEEFVDVAAAVFVGLKIGCLPVVKDGELTGIVTEMDLLAAFASLCKSGRLSDEQNPDVSTCMTSQVSAATLDTSLQDAFSMCLSLGVRHLPVMEDGVIVGIVSDRDLRAAAHSGHEKRIRLGDIMAHIVEVVAPETLLSEAALQMVEQKVTTLPVLRHEQLVGMLSLSDVLVHCVSVLREV